MVLWRFPNDPKLDGMERIGDPQQFLALLRTLPTAAALAPVSCEGSVVKYVPGKRLVMKQIVRDAAGQETILYTKTFGHERGEAIYAVMRHLFECSHSAAGALTTPEPLGWLGSVRTLVQRELVGWSAVETLRDDAWQRFMQDVGTGLAHIHASGAEGLEAWSSQDELDNLQHATQLLLDHQSRHADRIEMVRTLAAAQRPKLPPAPQLPIHTAFRYTQLLADADRLALVDFDGFRQGDAACDVGSFLAHLHYLAVKNEITLAHSREAAQVFLRSYRAAASHPVDDAALAWYTAVILVAKHAQKMVKRLKEDGDEKLERLLRDAVELLQRSPLAE
jgi:thiamine kinase-like enzyme